MQMKQKNYLKYNNFFYITAFIKKKIINFCYEITKKVILIFLVFSKNP